MVQQPFSNFLFVDVANKFDLPSAVDTRFILQGPPKTGVLRNSDNALNAGKGSSRTAAVATAAVL
jgi:hypothetical protein